MKEKGIYIHHFSIMAPSDVIERTMQFYRDLIGIAPGYRPKFSLPGYWLYSGDNPIIHLTAKDDKDPGTSGYLHHIALRCTNIDGLLGKLTEANIEYRKQDLNDVGQVQVTVLDPAGNLVELNFEQ